MLDLGGIPLTSDERTLADPLVIAGGPCAQNPEPVANFIDVFVVGDGEPSLPRLCDAWLEIRDAYSGRAGTARRDRGVPTARSRSLAVGGAIPVRLRPVLV